MKASLEKISYFGNTLNLFHFAGPSFEDPFHFHPEYELACIVNGQGSRFVGDSVEEFSSGDCALIGANLPHVWYNQKPSKAEKGFVEAIACQFRHNLLGTDIWNMLEFSGLKKLLEDSQRGLLIPEPFNQMITERVAQFVKMEPSSRLFELLQILDLLVQNRESLTYLASATYQSKLDKKNSERLDCVFQLVHQNFTSDISLKEAALVASLSPAAFCRYFRNHTGKTFVNFLNEVRIGQAKRELNETEDSILEIAIRCGFNSLSHFNRVFLKLTEVSPSQFRKSYQKISGLKWNR